MRLLTNHAVMSLVYGDSPGFRDDCATVNHLSAPTIVTLAALLMRLSHDPVSRRAVGELVAKVDHNRATAFKDVLDGVHGD